MKLTFDPETHRYFIGQKEIPGVSSILQKVGLAKKWEGIDPFYSNRGIATHLAIQYFLEGYLDEKSLDPIIVPFFEGFKKYISEHPLGKTRCEVMGASLDNSFAGTVDCISEKRGIIDWKCSKSHDPVAELQGEAYKTIALVTEKKLLSFTVVQLPGNGDFQIFEYGDKVDHWASVMDLYRWRVGLR